MFESGKFPLSREEEEEVAVNLVTISLHFLVAVVVGF